MAAWSDRVPALMSATLNHRSLRHLGVAAATSALLLAGSGCSAKSADNPNLVAGKQQFVARCGSCHTLERAATKGVVGPNLDAAFRASLAEGLKRSTIRGVVKGQVLNPNNGGVMPANLAGGATLEDIAAYVADSVDQKGSDKGLLAAAVQAPGAGKPAVETGGKLSIPADPNGQLAYATNKASATAGPVTIEMPNMSSVSHNIAVQQGTGGAVLASSKYVTKGNVSVSVTLKPGAYTFFCEAPGHRQAGMEGTLTVK